MQFCLVCFLINNLIMRFTSFQNCTCILSMKAMLLNKEENIDGLRKTGDAPGRRLEKCRLVFHFSICVPVVFQLCSICVPVVFQLCSGCVPVAFRLRSGCVPVAFRLRSGCVPVAFRLRSGCVPVAFRLRSGCVPVAFRLRSGCVPVAFRLRSGCVPVAFRLRSGCVPVAFRLCSGCVPVVFQLGNPFSYPEAPKSSQNIGIYDVFATPKKAHVAKTPLFATLWQDNMSEMLYFTVFLNHLLKNIGIYNVFRKHMHKTPSIATNSKIASSMATSHKKQKHRYLQRFCETIFPKTSSFWTIFGF